MARTLKSLLAGVDFAGVWNALRAWHPETVGDANMADYLAAFNDLRARAAVAGEYVVRVRRFTDEVHGEIIDVDGVMPGDDAGHSLVALPWAEWLGGEVRIEGEVTDAEAAACCLHEIVFLSFDEPELTGRP